MVTSNTRLYAGAEAIEAEFSFSALSLRIRLGAEVDQLLFDATSTYDVARSFKQLAWVERGLRTLKAILELSLPYHRRPARVGVHMLLCWPAPLLVRLIELETG